MLTALCFVQAVAVQLDDGEEEEDEDAAAPLSGFFTIVTALKARLIRDSDDLEPAGQCEQCMCYPVSGAPPYVTMALLRQIS